MSNSKSAVILNRSEGSSFPRQKALLRMTYATVSLFFERHVAGTAMGFEP